MILSSAREDCGWPFNLQGLFYQRVYIDTFVYTSTFVDTSRRLITCKLLMQSVCLFENFNILRASWKREAHWTPSTHCQFCEIAQPSLRFWFPHASQWIYWFKVPLQSLFQKRWYSCCGLSKHIRVRFFQKCDCIASISFSKTSFQLSNWK